MHCCESCGFVTADCTLILDEELKRLSEIQRCHECFADLIPGVDHVCLKYSGEPQTLRNGSSA